MPSPKGRGEFARWEVVVSVHGEGLDEGAQGLCGDVLVGKVNDPDISLPSDANDARVVDEALLGLFVDGSTQLDREP